MIGNNKIDRDSASQYPHEIAGELFWKYGINVLLASLIVFVFVGIAVAVTR